MVYQVSLIAFATVLITVPQWFSTYAERRHADRLAALRNGAPEKFFEERRSLETYRPRGVRWPYRLFGFATMAFAIGSLVLHHWTVCPLTGTSFRRRYGRKVVEVGQTVFLLHRAEPFCSRRYSSHRFPLGLPDKWMEKCHLQADVVSHWISPIFCRNLRVTRC